MMKKVIVSGVLVATVLMVVFGQSYWNDQVERTAAEALEYSRSGDDRTSSYVFLRDGYEDELAYENGATGSGSSRSQSSNDDGRNNDENGNGSSSSTGSLSTNGDQSNGSGSTKSGDSGTTGTSGSSGTSSTSGSSGGSSGSGSTGSTSGSGTSGSTGSSSSGSSTLSAQQIIDTYFTQFERLQSQEVKRVNQIVSEAESDFADAKAGNHEKTERELRTYYLNEMQRLESQADARFNDIIKELRAALEEHGHDPSKAREFEAVYESEKEARRLEAVQAIFQ